MPSSQREKTRRARQTVAVDKADQILDVAEALFAQFGFHGVSVRDVTKAAKIDVALVYYYFENKRALFDAVLLRRAAIVNAERMERLEALEKQVPTGEDAIEKLIAAFTDPIYEYLKTGDVGWRHYFALVAQINNAPEWGSQVMPGSFDPIAQKLIDLLRKVAPEASDADLYWGFHFLSGALTLGLAGTGRIDRLSGGLCLSTDYTTLQRRLPSYVAAGFRQFIADNRTQKRAESEP